MSVERALVARLLIGAPEVAAVIGDRLYPTVAPINVTRPYAVFQRISTQRVRSLLAASGLAMARFQIDAYADSYAAARQAVDAIRKRLDAYRGTVSGAGWSCQIAGVSLLSDADLYEPDAEPPLYRASMDFMISYQEG